MFGSQGSKTTVEAIKGTSTLSFVELFYDFSECKDARMQKHYFTVRIYSQIVATTVDFNILIVIILASQYLSCRQIFKIKITTF